MSQMDPQIDSELSDFHTSTLYRGRNETSNAGLYDEHKSVLQQQYHSGRVSYLASQPAQWGACLELEVNKNQHVSRFYQTSERFTRPKKKRKR